MRGLAPILAALALLASVPLITSSNVVLNFLVVTLLIALVAQGWNLLGGYGGQYSFGHAAFFGTGAYVTAVLQTRYGVNAWLGFCIGVVAGALVGAVIGALSFRSGLKGSYFALVTLAFASSRVSHPSLGLASALSSSSTCVRRHSSSRAGRHSTGSFSGSSACH